VQSIYFHLSGQKKHSGQLAMNRSKQAGMSIKTIIVLLVGLALASVRLAEAQEPKKVPRIGVLAQGSRSSYAPLNDAFQQGLHELGYNEGKNIVIEYRYAEGEPDRLPGLVVELVRLNVNVIVTSTTPAHQAAKQATTTIPIVMAQSSDPVGEGFVESLARPGGNITGLSSITQELGGKRLELFKEAVPRISRLAVIWSSPTPVLMMKEIESTARALSIQIQSVEVRPADDLSNISAMTKKRPNALFIIRTPLTRIHARPIIDFAAKSRLPTMYDDRLFVETGGLMSYGVNIHDLYRRTATYVDKILKGAKPADLPVEQPMKFELVINLKTAKQIGLTIPQSVLSRADRVVK
jgi:putative ABC transport system substrate-binding protein